MLLASGCGGGSSTPAETATPASAVQASGAAISIDGLARAVVQVHALDSRNDTVWTGSGTFVSRDGLILTNAHVVDDRYGEYDHLAVATSSRTDEPAELAYLAEIVAVDYALDLAVIAVTSDVDGNEVVVDFPYVEVGNSDDLEIGDEIRILGYPGIGGETITFTKGAVSGFTADRSVSGRAWIKTDATIAGGNSGGLAVNAGGQLVGVPTIVGSGADTDEFVDCRYVADTNGDGRIDSNDDCVPVGGFINGMRPVNLALPLIDAAESGQEYVSALDSADAGVTPGGSTITDEITFGNLIFSDGVTDRDEPTGVHRALPSAVEQVCGFWDYAGMLDGVKWDAQWFVDGELDAEGSIIDDTWVGGEGGNWWVCIINEDTGLADGLYELVLSVDGDFQDAAAIWVGGDHPNVELTIDNSSSFEICYAYISPVGAKNWGEDHLGDQTVPAGDTTTVTIAAGNYDIMTMGCDDEAITEDHELDIREDSRYTVTDS